MNDRELLEAAAKAAGEWPSPEPFEHVLSRWNPLTDDGDALRLAVACGLAVDTSRPSAGPPFYSHVFAQMDFTDRHAATRRAIVRAAAEIGRSKT